ncbi:MAG: hypothetical protein P4N59_07495 [Negativicutes bacterium]|nr:hypothetical protein [Negativicutes bacterium]
MNFAALEEQLLPEIRQLLASPAVQQDLEQVAQAVTSYLVEIIEKEVSTTGFSALVGKIINKIKELFGMKKQYAADTGAGAGSATGTMAMDVTPAASVPIPSWTDTRTQGELEILSAGINAMASHQSWPAVRDSLIPSLVSLLVNYGINLAVSKAAKK